MWQIRRKKWMHILALSFKSSQEWRGIEKTFENSYTISTHTHTHNFSTSQPPPQNPTIFTGTTWKSSQNQRRGWRARPSKGQKVKPLQRLCSRNTATVQTGFCHWNKWGASAFSLLLSHWSRLRFQGEDPFKFPRILHLSFIYGWTGYLS